MSRIDMAQLVSITIGSAENVKLSKPGREETTLCPSGHMKSPTKKIIKHNFNISYIKNSTKVSKDRNSTALIESHTAAHFSLLQRSVTVYAGWCRCTAVIRHNAHARARLDSFPARRTASAILRKVPEHGVR